MRTEPIRALWKPLALAFSQRGATLYAVGGFVRDGLLNRPNEDVDLASALLPQQVEELLRAEGIPYRLVNPRLGTLWIWMGEQRAEYTSFRTESYGTGGSHRPDAVTFTDSLVQDALRRDFTANALYEDLLTGEIVDPLSGRADIGQRVLRAARPEAERTLSDDGLRILRLARFAARLDFSVAEDTFRAAKANVSLLRDVAWERKREELDRILMGERVYRGLTLLYELGALPYLLPELMACEGVAQRSDYHAYDVLFHQFHACAAASPTPIGRLSALLHDVGKPAAKQRDGTFHMHPLEGERLARTMLTRLRYPKDTVERVCFLIRNHMFDLDGRAKEATLRQRFCLWGKEAVSELADLREADVNGSGKQSSYRAERWRAVLGRMIEEGVPFQGEGLTVDGSDIVRTLSVDGAAVGRIKEKLVLHCAVHPEDNQRERLLKRMHDYR